MSGDLAGSSRRLDLDLVVGADPVSRSSDAGSPLSGSNLTLRVISGAVLAPVAILSAYLGGWAFALFWAIAAIIVLWEWTTLVVGTAYRLMFSSCAAAIAAAGFVAWLGRPIAALLMVGLGALAAAIFAPRERRLWVTAGICYAGAMLLAPMFLRADSDFGFATIVLLFAVVWTTDVLGYFAGRAFGGPKLLPAVSPKKTWSGAVAGGLGAVIAALLVMDLLGSFNKLAIGIVALLLSVMAQLGDLLESRVKRQFGAKDASHLIPGHGGVMDRLDGFWAAAVIACLIGLLRGGFAAPARGLLLW
ncbi:MAG TPA: phosphatidate cytidylyltransferase [Pseudolabrys sp.]|nr:phosphatidate cytidylyltransferase [Pseudolabrys sp.]